MRTSLRNTILFFSFLAMALSVFMYTYLYRQTGLLVEKTISSRKIVSVAEANRAQSKDIVRLHESTAFSRAGLSSLFVPVESGVEFIEAIETIGTYSKVKINISSIKETLPDKDSKTGTGQISADVSTSGSWAQVMRTLELFETMPYRLSVNNVSLNSSGSDRASSTKTWQLGLSLAVSTLDRKETVATTTKK